MNNIMDIDGHRAIISFDPESNQFRGEFIGLNGGADFYAKSVQALRKEGDRSLKTFLVVCEERGIEPYKSFRASLWFAYPRTCTRGWQRRRPQRA